MDMLKLWQLLREDDPGIKEQVEMTLRIEKHMAGECPLCSRGLPCPICDYAKEIKEAVDAEIGRRKKRGAHVD